MYNEWPDASSLGGFTFEAALALVVIIATLLTLLRWRSSLFDDDARLQYGCRPPPKLMFRWPLAIDIIVEAFRADKQGLILEFFLRIVSRTGNTFEQRILGARGIDTQDPQNIEAILSTQFNDFGLGAREQNFRPLLGHGIFTQNGPSWRQSRDLLRPQFMRTRSEYFQDVRTEVEKLVDHLKNTASGRPVDLQPLFFCLTLDVTTAVFFGKSVNSLADQDTGLENNFGKAFNYAQHQLARRGRLGDLYWLLGGRSFRKACGIVHQFVDGIVADGLARSKTHLHRDKNGEFVFLDALIAETQDPKVIRDQLVNILLAGRDTTACLLSWTFRLLAQHQEVQAKLREECLAVSNKTLDRDVLKGMKYLRCILKEVLRLYPSVPINSRTALKRTTLPVGGGKDGLSPILVRKGEAVGYCVYSMHRRRDLYGEDVEAFRPERWADDPAAGPSLKSIGWAYIPFNAGPRACLGQEFALLEASYATVRLLQTFGTIEPERHSNGNSVFNDRKSVTLVAASRDGCRVVLE